MIDRFLRVILEYLIERFYAEYNRQSFESKVSDYDALIESLMKADIPDEERNRILFDEFVRINLASRKLRE